MLRHGTLNRKDYKPTKLSRFFSSPRKEHWIALKRVIELQYTELFTGGSYGGSLTGYVDAAYGDYRASRRSTARYVFLLEGGAVSWKSRRQPAVALSTAEAEYMAATQGAKEAIWGGRLLSEIGRMGLIRRREAAVPTAVPIKTDNQGAPALAQNPEFHDRTKHIDIQHH